MEETEVERDMKLKSIWPLLKETYSEWSADKASRLAAALAYYTIFSIAPLLVITIAIVGLFFGQEAARGGIDQQIRGLVGDQGASAIQEMIANAGKQSSGILATVFGVIALLFGATGVFSELHGALNTIWEVEEKPRSGVVSYVRDRFLSLTMVLGIGFLLLVSLALSAALASMGSFFHTILPGTQALAHGVNFIVSIGIVTLLFAMMYKFLPDVKIAWRDVWIGAALTAFLFAIGKFLIGFYLGTSSMASAYGAAGALVLVLVWVYYSAQIFFLGAEFTQVYARRYGSRIEPAEDAVRVTGEKRAEQGMHHRTQPAPRRREAAPVASLASVLTGVLIGFAVRIMRGSRTRAGT